MQVAKAAADIVLLDDSFNSIVTACKYARMPHSALGSILNFLDSYAPYGPHLYCYSLYIYGPVLTSIAIAYIYSWPGSDLYWYSLYS